MSSILLFHLQNKPSVMLRKQTDGTTKTFPNGPNDGFASVSPSTAFLVKHAGQEQVEQQQAAAKLEEERARKAREEKSATEAEVAKRDVSFCVVRVLNSPVFLLLSLHPQNKPYAVMRQKETGSTTKADDLELLMNFARGNNREPDAATQQKKTGSTTKSIPNDGETQNKDAPRKSESNATKEVEAVSNEVFPSLPFTLSCIIVCCANLELTSFLPFSCFVRRTSQIQEGIKKMKKHTTRMSRVRLRK